MVYDGDCGFCRARVARWRGRTGGRVDYAPYQEAAARFPEIPVAAFREAVQLVETDGQVHSGAEAVFRALAHAPRGGAPWWAYRHVPAFAAVSEAAYAWVARHRDLASRFDRWTGGDARSLLVRWLFLRALGAVYLIAFASLWVQVDGLIGAQGILPAATLLEHVREAVGSERYRLLPTLLWLGASDGALHALCAGGVLLALALLVGAAPALVLFLLWAGYLSLLNAGGMFLGYQWDALLLETGLLAVLLAPRGLWPGLGRDAPPSRPSLWLMRWLLFRLMFSSGVTKLMSGDPTWRDLTALRFHYETQPLPTWIGWYAHQLPAWVHAGSAGMMFVIEVLLPCLVFAPPRWRRGAFGPLVGLQVLIALTGNYGFFNLLSIALCLFLLDDAALPRRLRARFDGERSGESGRPRGRAWPVLVTVPAAAVLALVSTLVFSSTLRLPLPWPAPLVGLYQSAVPFASVHSYGLFQVMTTSRLEIVIEGSADGVVWKAYEFRWKPGDPGRPPAFVEPHQPRLDWQMWFAALGRCEENDWFVLFLERLQQGSPPVRSLLAHDPFPTTPPALIRTTVYDYRFTDRAERARTGAWWRRQPLGPYCPILRRGRPVEAAPSGPSLGTSW